MPTTLGSEAISAKVDKAIRERSFFSAKLADAAVLQRYQDTIDKVLDISEQTQAGTGATVMRAKSEAQARTDMRQVLKESGYVAPEGKKGTIEDFASDSRLKLIIETQTQMAKGHGFRIAGMEQDELAANPAWELFRLGDRKEPRHWPDRWREAGGSFFEGEDADYPEGRMVALKTDPIWEAISAFDLPYPPFDFNSGMWLRPIGADEAVELELLTQKESDAMIDAEPQDEEDDSAGGLAASAEGFGWDLLGELMDVLGVGYRVIGGAIKKLTNRRMTNASGEVSDMPIHQRKQHDLRNRGRGRTQLRCLQCG